MCRDAVIIFLSLAVADIHVNVVLKCVYLLNMYTSVEDNIDERNY